MNYRNKKEPPPFVEKLPFNTISVKVGQGVWCFETEGFAWKYLEQQGMNLGLHQPSGEYTFQLHATTLHDAVIYAWGFRYGWKGFRDTFKDELTAIKKEATELKNRYEKLLEELKHPSPNGA